MASSPWLSSSITSQGSDSAIDHRADAMQSPNLAHHPQDPSSSSSSSSPFDPWSDSDLLLNTPTLSPSSIPSTKQQQQRSGHLLSPHASSLTTNNVSTPAYHHPLRSPSPSQGLARRRKPSSSNNAEASRSSSTTANPSPSAGFIASEWKAIGAGLAGIFNSSSESRPIWPSDQPNTTLPSTSHHRLPVPSRGSKRGDQGDDDNDGDDGQADRLDSEGSDPRGHSKMYRGIASTTALDRLEGWFGLRENSAAIHSQGPNRPPRGSSIRSPSPEAQVRVLIHPVAPTDTLSSLALHYGADIQTLRKSNKLWPGDAAQMRKEIYIPIDSCKYRPPNAEIKLLSSNGGGLVVPSDPSSLSSMPGHAPTPGGGLSLAFVPKQEDEDDMPALNGDQVYEPMTLISPAAEDPALDFMPDTNKSYVAAEDGSGRSSTPIPHIGSSSLASRPGSSSESGAIGAGYVRGGGSSVGPYSSSLSPSSTRKDSRKLTSAASLFSSETGSSQLPGSSASAVGSKRTPSRSGSVGARSNNTPSLSAASASAASGGFQPPKGPLHVAKVPAERLKFFSKSSSSAKGKGKGKDGDGEASGGSGAEDLTSSLNIGPDHPDYNPGESGLDDLLSAKRRLEELKLQESGDKNVAGSSQNAGIRGGGLGLPKTTTTSLSSTSLSRMVSSPQLRGKDVSNDGSDRPPTSFSDVGTEEGEDVEEWKPNVWKFGRSSEPKRRGSSETFSSAGMMTNGTAIPTSNPPSSGGEGGEAERMWSPSTRTSPLGSTGPSESYQNRNPSDVNGGYRGWNDAPPPDAIVSRAYDTGEAQRKGRVGRGQQQRHHRILNDLAAGLPANTGAAKKWARPINFGDSLPPPPPSSSAMTNGPPRRGASGGLRFGSGVGGGGTGGFGKLLNDTIRGRISIEGAFEAALEEVRQVTSLDLPHHQRRSASSSSSVPPLPSSSSQRLVTEVADHPSPALRDGVLGGTGRREAERSPAMDANHELEELEGREAAVGKGNTQVLTSSLVPTSRNGSGGVRARPSARGSRVDWIGSAGKED
ncbi:hypothetical protein IE53DRAFT_390959 [Violaceomyces palustris]|uniref:Uncharacterized protein n=1 Tax=Violaceomyces palustris TaxID=1673888 RepID=A0ACD0NM45_9BASI|nr:hypothetical protein IE53DRAFT_390959 [Violaceomyces palustris]